MSYFSTNGQGKVRLRLSSQAMSVIECDMCTFGIRKYSTFINTVISNYISMTKTLPSSYLQHKKRKMLDNLDSCNVSDKERVVDCLIENEFKAIKKELREYADAPKDRSIPITLNKANLSYFNSDFPKEDIEFYRGSPGAYLKCLLEEYVSQGFLQRERIYRKDVYDKLEHAISLERALEITTVSQTGESCIYYVYPYKILSDITRTQDYLTCFSKLPDQPKNEKTPAAFAVAKLNAGDIRLLNDFASLDTRDLKKMQELLSKNSPGNLLDETVEIHVELTAKGEYFYRTSLYNRPTRLDADCRGNIYKFQCTPYRALHYFASFGKEAKILCPDSLRDSFLSLYKEALKQYT